MKYTLMIHETAEGFAQREDAAHQKAYWEGTMAYVEAIRAAGVLVTGAGLMPPDRATSVSWRDGKRHVQDGPFAESRHQLGGLFIIDVESLDVALEWAARFPRRPGLIVEVRPNLAAD